MLSLIDVKSKFHDEHIAFSRASSFIFWAEAAARKGIEPLAESHADLAESVADRYGSPTRYFLARLFIAHISAFELFLQESVIAIAFYYPQKVGSVQFRLADILATPDTEELVQRAAEEVLHKLMYKKPAEYLADLANLLSFPATAVEDLWPIFVEAKARRDLGVHSGWVCNAIYQRKLAEAGAVSAAKLGDVLLPTEGAYIKEVSDALYELTKRIYNHSSQYRKTLF